MIVAFVAVVAIGVWWITTTTSDSPESGGGGPQPPVVPVADDEQWLIVVPFRNVGPDENDDYWGHGISNTLSNQLAGIGVNVRSYEAVRRLYDQDKAAHEMALELAADLVLHATYEFVGDDDFVLEITLVRAEDAKRRR